MNGDVRGQALGWNDLSVGGIDLGGTSVGGYWTRIGQGGWYLDGVVMATFFGGYATSSRDVGIDIDGTGVTASLEGGYPIALAQGWTLEPQAQLVWQHLSLDDTDGPLLVGLLRSRRQRQRPAGRAAAGRDCCQRHGAAALPQGQYLA